MPNFESLVRCLVYTCTYILIQTLSHKHNVQHEYVVMYVYKFCVLMFHCVLCKVHGRHVAVPRMISGAYAQEYGQAEEIDRALHRVQVYTHT